MSPHAETIRLRLSRGPLPARQLAEKIGISQPTVSRALAELGDEVVRIGAARSIHYALRDTMRGLPDIPVYRIDAAGRVHRLGVLVPVRLQGFVTRREDGAVLYSEDLPWWLADMRPQGYLGRALARRHAAELELPERLADWTAAHALRALLAYGHDVVGDLLLGDAARDRFIAGPVAGPISLDEKAEAYVRLSQEAVRGEVPGSSAGGEQPKFAAYAMTPGGARHVLVKFSEPEPGPVTERWRDLLLAEHLALETLGEAGVLAARTRILDSQGQRFLEVERFDRIGALGRRGVFSLTALDAEFVGEGRGGWPSIAQRLAGENVIRREAAADACLLWAFGTLIGNSDMHGGNLSFMAGDERPYGIAPAYDMTPMAFQPRASGGLPDALPAANVQAGVPNDAWRRALVLAQAFLARLRAADFSRGFQPCLAALAGHLATAGASIGRLG